MANWHILLATVHAESNYKVKACTSRVEQILKTIIKLLPLSSFIFSSAVQVMAHIKEGDSSSHTSTHFNISGWRLSTIHEITFIISVRFKLNEVLNIKTAESQSQTVTSECFQYYSMKELSNKVQQDFQDFKFLLNSFLSWSWRDLPHTPPRKKL